MKTFTHVNEGFNLLVLTILFIFVGKNPPFLYHLLSEILWNVPRKCHPSFDIHVLFGFFSFILVSMK